MTLLRELYGTILIGGTVYHEVVEDGRKIGAPEVVYVERAMTEGWLRKEERTLQEAAIVEDLCTTTRLHEGEAEALAMAARRGALLLVDDKEGRSIAARLGVKRIGTAGVLLEACLRHHLSISELEEAISDLTSVSWQSPAVATLVLRLAREAES